MAVCEERLRNFGRRRSIMRCAHLISIAPRSDRRVKRARLLLGTTLLSVIALTSACSDSATRTIVGTLKSCDEHKLCTYVYEDGSEAEVDFSNANEIPQTIVDEADAK